jgi:hypothetical protein
MLFGPAIKSDQTGHQAAQTHTSPPDRSRAGLVSIRLSQDGCGTTTRRASVTVWLCTGGVERDFPQRRFLTSGRPRNSCIRQMPLVTTTVKVDRSGPSGDRICYPSVKYAHDRDIAYAT